MRRLIDLPGMADLEQAALMNSRYADADARDAFPELDERSRELFGLTADEAGEVPRPPGWDGVDRRPLRDQVAAFEQEGWDVTDKRRPLRTLPHFNVQLWLALRGVAGQLPGVTPDLDPNHDGDGDGAKGWAAAMQADAKRFKRDRR